MFVVVGVSVPCTDAQEPITGNAAFYVPGVGEAFPVAWPPAPQHHFWPLLAEPMLDVPGLECPHLSTKALQKAYTACFPAEAMDTRPLGFYAQ